MSTPAAPDTGLLTRHSKFSLFGRWGSPLPTKSGSPHPFAALPPSDYKMVECGDRFVVAVNASGEVVVCGSNRHGQLGMGHDSFVVVPTINPALRPASMTVLKVSCGTAHTAVLVDPGRLFMMGCGEYGRLGFGDTRDVFSPQELVIYPGSSTSARQPGSGPTSPVLAPSIPTPTPDPYVRPSLASRSVTFLDVACGDRHTVCVGHTSGTVTVGDGQSVNTLVFAWGDGSRGRLGTGDECDSTVPVQLTAFQPDPKITHLRFNVLSVFAGVCHSAAISSRGELFTWGCGGDGMLGHGGVSSEWLPRRVEAVALHRMLSVSFGARHCLGIDSSGRVFAWGRPTFGRLGLDAAETNSDVCKPKLIPALSSRFIVQVSAGESHSAAVDDKGTLYVWGDGSDGKLGSKYTDDQRIPVPITAHEILGVTIEPMQRRSPRPSDSRESTTVEEPAAINSRRPSLGAPHSRPTPVRRISSIRINTKAGEDVSDRRRKSGTTDVVSRTLSGSHSPRSPRRQTVGNILKNTTGTASKPLTTVPEAPSQLSQRPAYIRRVVCGDSFTIVEVSEAVTVPHGDDSTDDERVTNPSPARVTFAPHVATANESTGMDGSECVQQPFLRLVIATARGEAAEDHESRLPSVTPALLDKEWERVREESERQAPDFVGGSPKSPHDPLISPVTLDPDDIVPDRTEFFKKQLEANTFSYDPEHDEQRLAYRVQLALRRQKRAKIAKMQEERRQAQIRLQGLAASPHRPSTSEKSQPPSPRRATGVSSFPNTPRGGGSPKGLTTPKVPQTPGKSATSLGSLNAQSPHRSLEAPSAPQPIVVKFFGHRMTTSTPFLQAQDKTADPTEHMLAVEDRISHDDALPAVLRAVSKERSHRIAKKPAKPPAIPPPQLSAVNLLSSTLRSQQLDASLKQTMHTTALETGASSTMDSGFVKGFSVVRTGTDLAALTSQPSHVSSAPVPPGGRRVTARGSMASPRLLHASFMPTPRKSSSTRYQPSPLLRHTPRPHSTLSHSGHLAASAINQSDMNVHVDEPAGAVPQRATDTLFDEFVVASEPEEALHPSPEAAANRRRVALRRVTIENLEKHTGVPES